MDIVGVFYSILIAAAFIIILLRLLPLERLERWVGGGGGGRKNKFKHGNLVYVLLGLLVLGGLGSQVFSRLN
jgi:hypothetical protein